MYCLDAYALWEINFGNEKFSKFLRYDFIVSDWTLIEFYRGMLREYGQETADYWLKKLKPHAKPVGIDMLIKAVLFQHENRKRKMSLFDCVGYIFSLEHDFKFVTGDKEFEHREGIEFIKK